MTTHPDPAPTPRPGRHPSVETRLLPHPNKRLKLSEPRHLPQVDVETGQAQLPGPIQRSEGAIRVLLVHQQVGDHQLDPRAELPRASSPLVGFSGPNEGLSRVLERPIPIPLFIPGEAEIEEDLGDPQGVMPVSCQLRGRTL